MKKDINILVIGDSSFRFNNTLEHLSEEYSVKSCSMDSQIFESEIKKYKADIYIVHLLKMDKWKIKGLYNIFINEGIPKKTIICIGNERECDLFNSIFKDFKVIMLIKYNVEELDSLITQNIAGSSKKLSEEDSIIEDEILNELRKKRDKKQVLVVDDDPIVLRLISSYLKDYYKVSVVNSGSRALDYLLNRKPDIILLDYIMPNMSGTQVLKEIRNLPDGKDIPVVFLTGVSDKEKVQECLMLNPKGYILKPVSKELLLDKLEKILNK